MKQELQHKIIEILSSIQETTKHASDFAMNQLPDIAQSYILYGRAMSVFNLTMCVLILGGLVWSGKKVYSRAAREGDELVIVLILFGLCLGFLGLKILSTLISDAGLVWFTPKVWLLKELASFIH